MAKMRIEFDDRKLRANLHTFDRDLHRRIAEVMNDEADYATGYLKANAPWSDDTGMARSGLFAVANDLGPGGYELVLSYSVHYGIYLELAHSGRYAVITPAMRVIGDKVLSDLRHIIDRIG